MSTNFTTVPVLDYNLLQSSATRAEFITQLRHALINVGFLYLEHPPMPPGLVSQLTEKIPSLFDDLSQEDKDAIMMANSPHFLGYSRLGTERTKEQTDMREQYDFATEFSCRWKEGEPEYLRLWGPSQWPPEGKLPGFRKTMTAYLNAVATLGYEFASLVSEALGLAPNALDAFYGPRSELQHRGKIVKYPTRDTITSDQGVGPHYDAGFLTFLLQASDHQSLQVQNLGGEWITVPPIPNTFVINIGKALDSATGGLARATSHRVLAPPAGSGARYSVPFFQNISPHARLKDIKLDFPPEILALQTGRGKAGASDSVNFSEFEANQPSSMVNLIGRVKSHPEVAQRHYPKLHALYFGPDS